MIPSPMKPMRSRSAMAASSRGLDPQAHARPQATRRLRGQLLAVEQVAPARAGLAPVRAARRVAPALGEQREAHLVERLQLAHDAVAAAVAAGAAGVAADGVLDNTHGELA